MAVEGMQGVSSSDMYSNDISVDDQTYIPHVNEYYHNRLKIDPNELYTFNDSDIIASEITVPHTEDNYIYNESVDCIQQKDDDEKQEFDFINKISNGDIKENIKEEVVPNGHYDSTTKSHIFKKETSSNSKVVKVQNHINKNIARRNSSNETKQKVAVTSGKGSNSCSNKVLSNDTKCSINSVNSYQVKNTSSNKSNSETFLDVFKREQMGVTDNSIKLEHPQTTPVVKNCVTTPRKANSCEFYIIIIFII